MSRILACAWLLLLALGACGDDDAPGGGGENTAAACANNIDDDGDGLTDCVDPGCAPFCGGDSGTDGGTDAGSECGDGFCDALEDSMSCPTDCQCECDVDFACSANCDCDPECSDQACFIARCEEGISATCDGALTLDCGTFGASCEAFSDAETGQTFSWCGCGSLANGAGRCLDQRDSVICEDGIALPAECAAGSVCDDSGPTVGCLCDNMADGICPAAECTEDPDCGACVPSCGSATCGDNGCGGSCGECSLGERCDRGSCVSSCTPNCDGRSCGDNGCGGSCGTCGAPATCNATSGQCESECVPFCAEGQTCGSDGCGGRCGSPCPDDRECRRCPSGGTCAVETYTCRCDFFSRVTYTFDASGLDWTDINGVALNFQHINLDGTMGRRAGEFLTQAEPMATFIVSGCEPNLQIKREYSVRGGRSCEIEERLTRTSLTVPQPTFNDGGGCTAPPAE